MFERYTENARRIIFFARYEASQFGSPYIETEHLLLGLLREDKALVHRFLHSHAAVESIRTRIEEHTVPAPKIPTTLDLPLSHESKRVLAYGAEESMRLNHKHIGTEHLLVGLLREEKSFGAQLLREQGVALHSVREHAQRSEPPLPRGGSAPFTRLDRWLAEREANGGIRTARQERVANRTAHLAIYPVDPLQDSGTSQDLAPGQRLAQMQQRIDSIVQKMEHAIANHEFEKARVHSQEEVKEREKLRLFREQFRLPEQPPPVPLLCIEIIRDEYFSEVQKRCDDFLAAGVTQVWLLNPDLKRAYSATEAEGLRECTGGILQIASPPLELDLKTIFD